MFTKYRASRIVRKSSPVLAALAMLAAGSAQATNLHDPTVSTCTGINCSSVFINGSVNGFATSAAPWTAEIFANTDECLRLAVTAQTNDLEIVAVQPNGTVFRNDDSGVVGCTLCPVVKINGARNGFYSVSISNFAGASVETNFTLAYGRYPLGNPNCAAPTGPSAAATQSLSKPAGGTHGGPVGDGPGR